MFPQFLAGGQIDGQEQGVERLIGAGGAGIRFWPPQHLHIKGAVPQQRARAVAELGAKIAMLFDQVLAPQQVAIHVQRGQIAAAKQKTHAFAIRDRRGRGPIVLGCLDFGAEAFLPTDFAILRVDADAEQAFACRIRGGDKDPLVPHNRRPVTRPRHGSDPLRLGRITRLRQPRVRG